MESREEQPEGDQPTGGQATVNWKPLTRNQRRVIGVLVEKSKTTPDVYPLSLNAVKTGCNQKSNRSPQLELQENEVEDALYELRHLGAAIEVHSGGRVPKFKHQMYDWLSVDKAELAVMAELLLRGEQTIGELRGRAARMESSISGLSELKPILASLNEKNLIVELTPPGRGQIVTHNLYLPDELAKLAVSSEFNRSRGAADSPPQANPANAARAIHANESIGLEEITQQIESLRRTVDELRVEVAELKNLIES